MAPHISIRDLGPIGRADLELKPLTIFVGPNNSGKSYAALTVYSLVRSMGEPDPFTGAFFSRRYRNFHRFFDQTAPELDAVKKVLRRPTVDVESVFSGQVDFQVMPDELQDLVRGESKILTDPLAERIAYEFERCFGVNLNDLGRRNRNTERSEFEIDVNDESTGLRWNLQCRNDKLLTTKWEPDISRGRGPLGTFRRFGQHIVDDPVQEPGMVFGIPDGGIRLDYLMNGYSAGRLTTCRPVRSGILLGTQDVVQLNRRRSFSGLDRTHERSPAAGGNH